MERLEPATYVQHIREESARFREVLTDCDPQADVPSCAAWRADDLLWHLGEVQHWWTYLVRHRPQGPDAYAEPVRPDTYAALLAFHDEQLAALTEALASATDPAEEAWTWSSDHTIGFILRRQAHEALIHRRDAELAAGSLSPFPPALAADGVDEVLDIMYGGCPPWGSFSPLEQHVRIDLTDTGDSVWVQLGRFRGTSPDGLERDEDDLHVVPDPGLEPDAVIRGTAEVLDARLWRRADGTELDVTGDQVIVHRMREVLDQPIS